MQPNYRRCVSCRRIAHRQELLRVVRTHPTRAVHFNHGAGRSAYLCPQIDCLNSAHKRNRLERSLRVAIPAHIYQELYEQIQ